jgi:predicted peptidase
MSPAGGAVAAGTSGSAGSVPEAGGGASQGDGGGVAGSGGSGGSGGANRGLAAGVQTARPLGSMPIAPAGYWEYLPKGYGDGVKRPLLIFWHGGGEKGTGSVADLQKVLSHGPPKLIAAQQWPEERPFIVLSPQHDLPVCSMAGDAHRDFLDYAVSAYDVDPTRVYQTGLSCGALGTEDFLARYGSSQLAAAVLIAGDITPAWTAKGCALVTDMALWALHGAVDTTVLPAGDNQNMPSLMACAQPHKQVKYDVYPGVDHDAWTRTYDLTGGHDIYAWLLTQKR